MLTDSSRRITFVQKKEEKKKKREKEEKTGITLSFYTNIIIFMQ